MSNGSTTHKLCCVIGLLSLLHCAYSSAQHRGYLRLTNQEFTHLPADIIIQTLLSLLLVCYSCAQIAGKFLPVRTDIQLRSKSWDTIGNCPSFITFEHRAKSLSPYFSSNSGSTSSAQQQSTIEN